MLYAIVLSFTVITVSSYAIAVNIDLNHPGWIKWLSFITDFDWEVWAVHRPNWVFALIAAMRVMLTLAPILGIGWLVIRFFSDWSNSMKLMQAVESRDEAIKLKFKLDFLKYVSPEKEQEFQNSIEKELNAIFTETNNSLKQQLSILYGSDRADEIYSQLNREI